MRRRIPFVLLTALFASPVFAGGDALKGNWKVTFFAGDKQATLWIVQLKAIGITIVFAVVGSAIIGAIVRGLIGLRIAPEIERQGLDINQHGEEGYITS